MRRLNTGQVVERGGYWPGLKARPVWDDQAWMLGLRLMAPSMADELAEVVFERARLSAEGAPPARAALGDGRVDAAGRGRVDAARCGRVDAAGRSRRRRGAVTSTPR